MIEEQEGAVAKTYDGIDALSKVSGVPRKEVNELWEQVKANHALLDSCDGHEFEPHERSGALVRTFKCTRCGGTLDSINVSWYNTGVEHERARAVRERE